MKKLIIMLFFTAAVFSASAQHVIRGGGYRPHTTVIVRGGYYPYYPSYPFYYDPFYTPSVPYRPSKLDQEIADINHDYAQRIESARMDKSISGKERRHEVRQLKEERDHEIDLAKRDYYKN